MWSEGLGGRCGPRLRGGVGVGGVEGLHGADVVVAIGAEGIFEVLGLEGLGDGADGVLDGVAGDEAEFAADFVAVDAVGADVGVGVVNDFDGARLEAIADEESDIFDGAILEADVEDLAVDAGAIGGEDGGVGVDHIGDV